MEFGGKYVKFFNLNMIVVTRINGLEMAGVCIFMAKKVAFAWAFCKNLL